MRGMTDPAPFHQDLCDGPDLAAKEFLADLGALGPEPCRAILDLVARHRRHTRGRRFFPRAIWETRADGSARPRRPSRACAGTPPRSRSGSPRSGLRTQRHVRAQRPGPRAATASTSARSWRRFMRFRIRSSPAWTDRCRCGISRGSSAIRRQRSSSISTGSSEDRREARQVRHQRQQAAHHLAQRRPARQVGAIGGQIDAGQHQFAIAGIDEAARLGHDLAHGGSSGWGRGRAE